MTRYAEAMSPQGVSGTRLELEIEGRMALGAGVTSMDIVIEDNGPKRILKGDGNGWPALLFCCRSIVETKTDRETCEQRER